MTVNGEEEDLGEHLHRKTMDGHEQARKIGALSFWAMYLCLVVGSFGSNGEVIVVNGKCVPHW